MSTDDLFDPERLRELWAAPAPGEAAPTPPLAAAPATDPAAEPLRRLEACLGRELGAGAARLEPLLTRARELFAARQQGVATAGEELIGLLDDIEDLVEALELRPTEEARA